MLELCFFTMMKKTQPSPDARNPPKVARDKDRARIFAKLLEGSSMPFALGYVDGRVGLCNEAFSRLLGFSQKKLLGLHWDRDLTPSEWQGLVGEQIAKLNRTGKPVRYEKEFFRRDGSRVPVELLVHLERDKAGAPQFYYGFVLDLTKRKQAEAALRNAHDELERKVGERTAQLRSLALELTRAEQRERRRVAHVIHDDLLQTLAAVKMQLGLLQSSLCSSNQRQASRKANRFLDDAIRAARSLTTELDPAVLRELGLGAALKWLAETLREKFGLVVKLESERAVEPASEELSLFVFHAIREVLFNVVKHAGIKTACVRIGRSAPARIQVQVEDDGAGFDQTLVGNGGFGLFSIRERAALLGGQMKVVSAPGSGTRVTLTVPG